MSPICSQFLWHWLTLSAYGTLLWSTLLYIKKGSVFLANSSWKMTWLNCYWIKKQFTKALFWVRQLWFFNSGHSCSCLALEELLVWVFCLAWKAGFHNRCGNYGSDIPKAFPELKIGTVLSNCVSILGQCFPAQEALTPRRHRKSLYFALSAMVSKGGQERLHRLRETGWP